MGNRADMTPVTAHAQLLRQLLRGGPLHVRPSDYLSEDEFASAPARELSPYVDLVYSSSLGQGIKLSWKEDISSGYLETARFHDAFSFLRIDAQLANDCVVTRHGDGCIVAQFFPKKTLVADGRADPAKATPMPACRLTRYPPSTAKTQRLCSPRVLSHFGIVLEPSRLASVIGMHEEELPGTVRRLCSADGCETDQVIEVPLTVSLCTSLGTVLNYDGNGPVRATYLYAKLLGILVEVVRLAGHCEQINCARYGLSERDEQILHRARNYVLSNLYEDLTLAGIARAVGTNRTKLAHGFRILFGQTVADFVREARLSRALVRLQSGPVSVTDVAFESGYADATTFGRAFKRRFGVSPRNTWSRGDQPAFRSARPPPPHNG